MTLAEVEQLLNTWVKNEKLVFHMQQVGHLMKSYAEAKGYDAYTQRLWHLSGGCCMMRTGISGQMIIVEK